MGRNGKKMKEKEKREKLGINKKKQEETGKMGRNGMKRE